MHASLTPNRPRLPSRLSAGGLSLLEACATLAIASILACGAGPQMTEMLDKARLQGRSQELVADLLQLKSQAITANQELRISVNADEQGTCYVLHTGRPKDCQCNSQGAHWCSTTEHQTFKAVAFPKSSGLALQSTSPSILFDPRLGGAAPGGTIRMTDRKAREIRHIVSLRGRIRTCAANATVSGQPGC